MNRLGEASSPYLLQHADNPVHWHPWDEEALRAARESGRPILLSVGYSACHWCHVMAHESFEDDATAEVMNELFVNVKVDREERPDLDKVYQTSHQLLTRRAGGWPLTVFLTHDELLPFFAGTYFPKAPRFGMPAFTDLLRNVAAYYAGRREEARGNGKAVREMLARIAAPGASFAGELDEQPLTNAFEQMRSAFDPVHGGTQGAPKFPRPADMELLVRRAAQPGGGPAREMLETTLDAMAAGGLNDHLGGGFFRYSVDARWEIPHFEKMLYDNAALLSAYSLAWQFTGKQRYADVADATAGWLMRDMRHEGGAFFAALDADSEGEEGLYYLWTPEQVRELLPEDEYDGFAARYGLNRRPNFEESAWHLVERPAPSVAEADFSAARQRLLEARAKRERPMRDEKLLTAWNAMAVRGLAIAGRCLERPDLTAAAEQAADFIIAEMTRDGRLLACWTDGTGRRRGISGRLRVLHRRLAGAGRRAAGHGRGAGADHAGQLRGPGQRRVLFHVRQPRAADPPAALAFRRRASLRRRGRGAGAAQAFAGHAGHAPCGGRRAHAEDSLGTHEPTSAVAHRAVPGAGRVASPQRLPPGRNLLTPAVFHSPVSRECVSQGWRNQAPWMDSCVSRETGE